MTELIKLICIGYLGMLLHLLKKLNEDRKKPGFTLGSFIKDQSITTLMSFIAIPLAIYIINDSPALQVEFPLTSGVSAMIGYMGQSWLLSFFDGKNKKKVE